MSDFQIEMIFNHLLDIEKPELPAMSRARSVHLFTLPAVEAICFRHPATGYSNFFFVYATSILTDSVVVLSYRRTKTHG